ncbi:unnamed protein product, partial [Symbiodinium sp. KB8]
MQFSRRMLASAAQSPKAFPALGIVHVVIRIPSLPPQSGDPQDVSGGDEEEQDPDDEPDAFEGQGDVSIPVDTVTNSGQIRFTLLAKKRVLEMHRLVADAFCSIRRLQSERPHRHSPFASQRGLCAEHWAEMLKERDILQRDFNGGSLLDRFLSPHYWAPPPPILLKEKHYSRPFFARLVCFFDDKRPKNRLFATYFLLLSVFAMEQRSTAGQLPARLASWREEFPVVGPLFAVFALADCITLGDLPEELQARWGRVEDSWQKSLRNSCFPGSAVSQNDINTEHGEDVLAIVAFWKHEGNECLKKTDLREAESCYSEGTKLIKELPPDFVADAMVSQAMELEADLLNNFALALLK